MVDESGNLQGRPLNTLVGTKPLRTKTLPVNQIRVDAGRRPVNDAKVSEMMESIDFLGLLHPIGVSCRTNDDGNEEYPLVFGRHRLEAWHSAAGRSKRLYSYAIGGIADVPCL